MRARVQKIKSRVQKERKNESPESKRKWQMEGRATEEKDNESPDPTRKRKMRAQTQKGRGK